VPTQIFALTGSSAYVGLTGLFGLLPLIVFGLWGGAIADAVDRRTLLLVTGAGIAAMSLALWVIAASGVGNVWVVLVLFAVQTALLAVNQPTRSAVIPRLVTPALLPAANTLNFTVFQLGSFLADIIAMAFGMPRILCPEMAERTFGDPPGGGFALGLLFAAIPIGAVVGGLFSGYLTRIRRQGVAVLVSICVWGLGVALFGLTSTLWIAVLLLAIAGAGDLVSAVFRSSMLQTVATDEM